MEIRVEDLKVTLIRVEDLKVTLILQIGRFLLILFLNVFLNQVTIFQEMVKLWSSIDKVFYETIY